MAEHLLTSKKEKQNIQNGYFKTKPDTAHIDTHTCVYPLGGKIPNSEVHSF